ncbi:GNAT family N-acetyltransferase [Paeniglutamicibacter psychrophenolicus]|uniref:GNAT family N-acetyltransferase n=1 Tax=Paeniglutamicibacter psychrophenolicus TaxID=257454 RepID=UPI001AEA25D2
MKPVSRFADPVSLDETMSRGWQALTEELVDGWTARFSGGVTKRANSVLPLEEPRDVAAAISGVEDRYAGQGLPAVFQISPDSLPTDLDSLLAERGYLLDSPTLVQYLALGEDDLAETAAQDPRIQLSEVPSDRWLETFWSVEGPHSLEQQAISRRILARTPSVYASLVVEGQLEAVARLALVGNLGGIYSVATREESRSRGHGRAVVQALLTEAAQRNLEGLWLQVVESNELARGLYESMGFETVSRYHYRLASQT